jgi:hypothetical protein
MTTADERTVLDPFTAASTRNLARIGGVLFLLTFVTSIVGLILYHPILHHHGTDFILGAGSEGSVRFGAFLEMLLIVANVGTAIVLFPVLRRQNEILALGWVTARIIESAFIAVGILSLLAIVTLRNDYTSADPHTLEAIGRTLVAVKDWTFLLGPGFTVGIGNGLLLGYLMYKSELVPKQMAILGLVGGPLIVLSGAAIMFDLIDKGSLPQGIATAPEFLWELSLGVYLTVKGFRPSSPIFDQAATEAPAG